MSNQANKTGNGGAKAGAATRERREEKPTPPQWWNVVLLDDDDHTYEYVIQMVTTLFRMSKARALEMATRVDNEGRAVLLTTHKEHAELKREQVHSWGADAMLQRSAGSMSCVIEPAVFENDGTDHSGNDGSRGADMPVD
ncbi:MAG: ATP-dependent Clp protease adaptor ClpS [Phycisphaerales bacterium]|nr:ATP-dependent Clp protease adaptor ClpS [Phycisphaerales bacterium]